jgi:hypothetical protein
LTGKDWRLSSVATKEAMMAVTTAKRILVSKEVRMRRSMNVGVALIGLLVVAAISVAAGSGRKPAKEGPAGVSLRRLSGSEVMDILNKFPEMVPSYLASSRNDTSGLVDMFGFIEVTSPELARVFRAARFYIGHDFWQPPQPYMMAVAGEKRYMLGDFNQLVLDNGLEVDDKRIIELAEAFVIFAVGSEMGSIPEVTFPESKRVNQVINGTPFKVMLKVEIDGQVDDWYFRVIDNQFSYVSRRGAKGIVKHYLPNVVEPLPSRGQLDPTPDMVIDTRPNGDAYMELGPQSSVHYYVILKTNQWETEGNRDTSHINSSSNIASKVYQPGTYC